VALGLAVAWRRLPGLTLGLAVPSAVTMIAATVSYPLIGAGGTHQWTARIGIANSSTRCRRSSASATDGWRSRPC